MTVAAVIDANLARCAEGLRVVEDLFRFSAVQSLSKTNLTDVDSNDHLMSNSTYTTFKTVSDGLGAKVVTDIKAARDMLKT